MSEFTFPCEQCGQHIAVDQAWSGHKIKCPTCNADVVVPQAPIAPAAAPKLTIHHNPPPVPHAPPVSSTRPSPTTSAGPSPVKFWVLALTSPFLMLFVIPLTFIGIFITKSWFGGLVSMIACVPALLCAKSALAERKTRRGVMESQLSGVGAVFAWTGMVLAYIWIILTVIGFCRYSYYKVTGTTPPKSPWSYSSSRNSGQQLSSNSPSISASPAETPSHSGNPARPVEPPVTTDPQTVTIPDGVPSGTVLGGPFTCTGIHYSAIAGQLDINQGNAANPQASVKLFLFTGSVPLSGRSIIVSTNHVPGVTEPHVHLKGSTGGVDAVTSGYVMRLEFSEPDAKGIFTGRIYLELPQSYQTKISGTFKFRAE